MNDEILKLIDISKTFNANTANEKKVFDHLNFTLRKGDFVTIIGSNGAGKSTLFNAISGSFLLDGGKIILDGKDITGMKDHQRALEIGRLFQDPMKGTAPNMTIEENLSLAYCRKAHHSFFAVNKKDSDYFRSLLSTLNLGLEDRMKTKIGLLSGGQRQALTLLMSTISTPKLLLLDEHTAALDPSTAQNIVKVTTQLVQKSNISTMMITHDINAALSMGNRTIVMDEGRIILDIRGEQRADMTVDKLLQYYTMESKKKLANDRMLFS